MATHYHIIYESWSLIFGRKCHPSSIFKLLYWKPGPPLWRIWYACLLKMTRQSAKSFHTYCLYFARGSVGMDKNSVISWQSWNTELAPNTFILYQPLAVMRRQVHAYPFYSLGFLRRIYLQKHLDDEAVAPCQFLISHGTNIYCSADAADFSETSYTAQRCQYHLTYSCFLKPSGVNFILKRFFGAKMGLCTMSLVNSPASGAGDVHWKKQIAALGGHMVLEHLGQFYRSQLHQVQSRTKDTVFFPAPKIPLTSWEDKTKSGMFRDK